MSILNYVFSENLKRNISLFAIRSGVFNFGFILFGLLLDAVGFQILEMYVKSFCAKISLIKPSPIRIFFLIVLLIRLHLPVKFLFYRFRDCRNNFIVLSLHHFL